MERHKFELLEDFHPPRDASNSLRISMEMQEFSHASPGKSGDWMQQKYSTETHPINLMVHNSTALTMDMHNMDDQNSIEPGVPACQLTN